MYRIANPDNADQYCGGTPFLKPYLYMIEINKWFFDFEKMLARRNPQWAHYDPNSNRNVLTINVNFGEVFVYENGHVRCGFFVEPEDHFNQKIVEAYMAFMAEKHLLE